MKKLLLLTFFSLVISMMAIGQDYAFGVKGGLTLGFQNWGNTLSNDALVSWHGITFIETADVENRFAVFAQLGYHNKGSALRNRNFRNILTGNINRAPATEFIFQNLSLILGGKQKYEMNGATKWYYLFGVRLDYTIDTNLDEFQEFNERFPTFSIYPIDSPLFIRNFNYGASLGAGLEFPFSEYISGLLEFTVNPDFSIQYQQPAIPNVTDPYTGNSVTLRERNIRNVTFEVTLGFRFLRKIEYID